MSSYSPLRNPLCLALDVDAAEEALKIAERLGPLVGGLKVGPRLIYQGGKQLVAELSNYAPLFVDCKFFDIPSTMEAAVRTSFEAGASLVTVHALAGEEALLALARLEAQLNQQRPFRILAVTILTSWTEAALPSNFRKLPLSEHVRQLAELAQRSGLKSVVCSAQEISILRDLNLFMLTPGIRFAHEDVSDQKRVVGPQEAMELGASALVVGRPILGAKDPEQAVHQYLRAMGFAG